MTLIRSILFQVLFYANLAGQILLYLPIFFIVPERVCWRLVKFWARSSLWLLRVIAGTRSHITGQAHIPEGPVIVASKHQSFWEVIALVPEFEKPTFILKKELMKIPVFGWYAKRMGMIPVDRQRRGAVLPSLLAEARKAIADGRQIIIFPEGTRAAPGTAPNYRPGIHFLYDALGLSIVPVGLNSGLFWPRQAVRRQPGTIRAEFLEPIAPGLKRDVMLKTLGGRIEASSDALMRRAIAEQPALPVSPLLAAHLSQTA